ncbi:MAG: YceI family protein [Halobacteriovoraceae bacterium]|nr:YceI family protein [Halobacteriovoraceae bacterium]
MKFTMLLFALLVSVSINAETVNLKKSSFTWKGAKIVGDSHTGPIKMKEAVFKNGKGYFIADMTTIDATDLKGEWKTKFLKHITSDDFFAIKKYPTAKLEINKVDNGYMYGKLTVKDKSHDVTVPITKNGNTYSGELGFDRTKYGVIYGSGNFFKNLGDKIIADTITLNFKFVTK